MGADQRRRRRRPRLFLNRITGLDTLVALEYGRVDDGQPEERWREVGDQVAYLYDGDADPKARSRCLGFKVREFSEIDPLERGNARLFRGARFDVPVLGIDNATAGEIILAAGPHFGATGSINRYFFDAAVELEGVEALNMWRACLESGDSMAHFALGYTHLDLGNTHAAYRHLRHYRELAPAAAWNHCWFGRAAEAIGELGEAREAYEIALELEEEDGETNAEELLEALEARLGRR
ncbi:hypothetical protein HJD18_12370 [Thermoleophilia bacterium SCSIO 60948]|nr:hypothetical protein HJD18_12370 [Thermoleophilia bacterium SCSIO 60948]